MEQGPVTYLTPLGVWPYVAPADLLCWAVVVPCRCQPYVAQVRALWKPVLALPPLPGMGCAALRVVFFLGMSCLLMYPGWLKVMFTCMSRTCQFTFKIPCISNLFPESSPSDQ